MMETSNSTTHENSPNTGDLIDFDSVSSSHVKVASNDSEVGNTSLESNKKSGNNSLPKKLNGFLTRLNPTGLIKGPKEQWFEFIRSTCGLQYYRSPNDINKPPIGSISVYNCSFSCNAEDLKSNTFVINTNNRQYVLQACDRNTMLWWLQELQIERRLFNSSLKLGDMHQQRGSNSNLNLLAHFSEGTIPGDHLTAAENTKENFKGSRECLTVVPVMPQIDKPPPSIGDQSARLRATTITSSISSGLADIGNRIPGRSTLRRHMAKSATLDPRPKAADIMNKLQSAVKVLNRSDNKTTGRDEYTEIVETLSLAQEEIQLMKLNLQSKDETIELLKSIIDSNSPGSSNADASPAAESTKNTKSKPNHKSNLAQAKDTEEVEMLQIMIQAKIHTIEQLAIRNDDMEKAYKAACKERDELLVQVSSSNNSTEDLVLVNYAEDAGITNYDTLKDEVEAYKFQNKFLSNEILELTHLHDVLYARIDEFNEKLLEQEARHCQLESKYLILLSEVNKPRQSSFTSVTDETGISFQRKNTEKDSTDLIKQLIEDALSDSTSPYAEKRTSQYDRHGFSMFPDDRDEASFLAASSMQQQKAANIMSELNEHDASVYVKWDNYLTQNKELLRTEELKFLLRKGVPHELRPYIWKWLVSIRTSEIRQSLDPSYYESLNASKVASLHSKQIELDLLRTLPNNKYFTEMSSDGIGKLRRILQAFSLHNPGIGYCQGLNRIAAIALLYLNEEDAFWCLVAIVEVIMPPDYYSSTLTASQADQRVLRDLIIDKMPRLHRHFESLKVDTSLVTFNWFLCVFCDNVPSETMFKVWDTFLNEGSKILFRFALAFFKHIEEDILQAKDYIAVFNVLRRMSHQMYDSREISQLAFQGMNPFPRSKIHRLRLKHLENVKKELAELDAVRSQFTSRRTTTISDMISDGEEDSG